MDSYDDLCPRCYRKNNKECRDCITQDALRAVRDALGERRDRALSLGSELTAGAYGEMLAEFEEGGQFEVKEG